MDLDLSNLSQFEGYDCKLTKSCGSYVFKTLTGQTILEIPLAPWRADCEFTLRASITVDALCEDDAREEIENRYLRVDDLEVDELELDNIVYMEED